MHCSCRSKREPVCYNYRMANRCKACGKSHIHITYIWWRGIIMRTPTDHIEKCDTTCLYCKPREPNKLFRRRYDHAFVSSLQQYHTYILPRFKEERRQWYRSLVLEDTEKTGCVRNAHKGICINLLGRINRIGVRGRGQGTRRKDILRNCAWLLYVQQYGGYSLGCTPT